MVFAFKIPVFLIRTGEGNVSDELIQKVYCVIDLNETDHAFYERQIESAAAHYEDTILPPFFKALEKYVGNGYSQLTVRASGRCFLPQTSGRTRLL